MIHVGQQFLSFKSVEKAIEDYEIKHHVKFMKLRTFCFDISEAPYNVDLRYKVLQFHCIRGGPSKRKVNIFRSMRTIKEDCPACIELKATSDKLKLEVKKVITTHSHALTQRWVYFKNGISKRLKEKLNLQNVFIRRNMYQLDGNENLVAALVEPRLLTNLQNRVKYQKKKKIPGEEVKRATESIRLEESPADNTILESLIENQPTESLPSECTRENNSRYISNTDEEVKRATEFIQLEESPADNTILEPLIENQPTESLPSECIRENNSRYISNTVMNTQKVILNTLNNLNEAVQSISSNMTLMVNTINSLNTSLSSITHIILPEQQILGP